MTIYRLPVKSLSLAKHAFHILVNTQLLMIHQVLLQHLDPTFLKLGTLHRFEAASLNVKRHVFIPKLIVTAIGLIHTDEGQLLET